MNDDYECLKAECLSFFQAKENAYLIAGLIMITISLAMAALFTVVSHQVK